MKKTKLLTLPVVALVGVLFNVQASAASLLPDNIKNIFDLLGKDGAGTANFITSKVSTALYFTLGVLVLFGIIYAIIAAFKYIRSEGDPGQIEEAQKGIKAIFYGILAMMIGIVGIVLLFVFVGADRPNAELTQVCLSAPGSVGCDSCKNGDETDPTKTPLTACSACEVWYAAIANKYVTKNSTTIPPSYCRDPLDKGDYIGTTPVVAVPQL